MNDVVIKLCKLIKNSKVYNISGYKYFVFPFKGIFPINCQLLKEIVNEMKVNISPESNKMFTFMTDGIIVALPIALEMNKSLIISRDFHYNLPNVISFLQETNYYKRKMYFTGVEKSDKIDIVDAVISSGKSILSAIDKLEKIGCEIKGIHTVANKVEYGGSDLLRQKGYKFFSLVDVKIDDNNKIICRPSRRTYF
jgi:adenine/guanine phosphoribosyltransferase-like PRPP-binding protein